MLFALGTHRMHTQSSALHDAYSLIRDADFLPFAFAAVIIFYIGHYACQRYPKAYHFGSWCGGISFTAYLAAAVSFEGYYPLELFFPYIVRGGLFAVAVVGASRLLLSIVVRTWEIFAPIPRYFKNKRYAAWRRAEDERRRLQEEQERIAQDERDRRRREEERRWAMEREKRWRELAAQAAADEQRRHAARAECELYYSQHVREIWKRFPKSMFDAFMRIYMNSDQPVDAVIQRAKELQRIIQYHRDASKPPEKFESLQQVTEWFLQEKQSIEALPIDEMMREELLIAVDTRRSELTARLLEKIGR